ncbi:MAG: PilZ domain-containing protein [Candidatus Acidiferrales bacterium]
MIRWREQRLAKQLPVRVRGRDSDGNPYLQETYTLNVSRRGARLECLSAVRGEGDSVEVEHAREKARFTVVWLGPPGTPLDNQVGIRCLDPTKNIWNIEFPPPERITDEPAPLPEPVLLNERRDATRRTRPRYRCMGGVDIWQEGAASPQPGTLAEISLGGCFLEVNWPLPVNTRVELHMRIGDLEVRAAGVVAYLDPSGGLGVRFNQLSPEDLHNLESLLNRLAS